MRHVFQVTGIKVFMCVSLLGVLLAGCSDPPAPVASDQSFRVTSVSTQVFKPGDRPVPLVVSDREANRLYFVDNFGLNRGRVLADLKKVMASSLVPASRQGTLDVHAEFVLYALGLKQGTSGGTYLRGWLDFYDAGSGLRVVSAELSVSPYEGMSHSQLISLSKISANIVHEYNKILKVTKDAMPKYLPQP